MLYLIGGAPRLGKSNMAKRLMDERRIPWLSTDVLCSMLHKGAGMQFANEMHLGTEHVVQKELREAVEMTQHLQQFMECQIDMHSDFTLEGVHLLPGLVSNMHRMHADHVRSLFVVSLDKELVLSGLLADRSEHNWMRDASKQMQHAMADFVVAYGLEMKHQAQKEGLPVFERTENFQKDIDAMLHILR